MSDIKTLNEKYFVLFSDLKEALEWIPEKQYEFMAKILYQLYAEELDICLTERELEVGLDNFKLKYRSRMYVPRRSFFGYNKIARRLLKQFKAEYLTALKQLELNVKEEKDVRKEIDDEIKKPSESNSTALTVAGNNVVAVGKGDSDETNS